MNVLVIRIIIISTSFKVGQNEVFLGMRLDNFALKFSPAPAKVKKKN